MECHINRGKAALAAVIKLGGVAMNWTAQWKKAAKAVRFDLSSIQPVQLELGYAGNAATLENPAPIFWMERELLAGGTLEINKRIIRERRLPSFELFLNVGMMDTLMYINDVTGIDGKEDDYIALLTEMSLREMPGRYGYYYSNFATELHIHREEICRAIGTWGSARWHWHWRSYRLAPDALIDREDFKAELGTPQHPRPIPLDAFTRIIVRGHQRLFNRLALVRPTYFTGAPPSIRDELDAWRAGREAEEAFRRACWLRDDEERQRERMRAEEEADRKRRELLAPEDRDKAFAKRDWSRVTKEELGRALHEHPQTHLAVMYGVTEAAIRKRMKKWELKSNRKGYWLRGGRRPDRSGEP
jgi:hypothetical protein